jgi:hypothetical protein
MATVTFTSRKGQSVVFAGSPYEMDDPKNFYGFAFTTNDDWYSTGDSKSTIDERPEADGAFNILRDWRPSLPITIVGWYRGPDRASVRAARRQLQLAIANGSEVDINFTDEDESTSRGLSIRSMVPGNTSGLSFPITIDGVALDPTAYGTEETYSTGVPSSGGGLLFPLGTTPTKYWDFGADGVSGRVTVTNNGTKETYPSLAVSGGVGDGFIVTDVTTGEFVTFSRNIPVGSTVSINQRTGVAVIDGQSDVSGSITTYGFFSIGPGETHVIQFSPLGTVTGTPQFTVTAQDAYL